MIRAHENSQAFKAGVLALLVHVLFFLMLVFGFNWKSEAPLQVTDVQLWDSLPAPKAPPLPPAPEPPKPASQPKVEPKPLPPPPPPEPKAEIVVKEKPKPQPKPEPKPEKKKEESPKPDPAIKKKEEELKKKAEEKKQQEALRKLQQEMLKDELAHEALNEDTQRLEAARNAEQARKAAAASSGAVNDATAKIQAKIRRYVNRQVCGSGKPVLKFAISLMPTGEVTGTPRLQSSSGIPACDQAVERAILQAQPLPVPTEPELFARFRDLDLTFRPNDDN